MAVSYGTYTITEVQEGSQIWTSSVAPTTPNYTFDVSHLTGDSDVPVREGDIILNSYYRYTVLSISSDGTTVLTGNRTSIRGEAGAASVTYALIVSNLAIVKDKDRNLSPSTITVTAKSQTGSNAMANYTGRIKIETTTNNLTWTSRINEDAATKTYTIPSDTVAIRCSLYLKGGTTTLLDQQTIPVVSDGTDGINGTNGKDGADGKDAYTVILTNENHTFAGNTTSAIASEIECNVIAYKGATQIAATIGTITGQTTGMTTSLLNNGTVNAAFKVNVTTSMVTKSGVLTVPITVDGKTFTKEFTYALTLDGEDGKDGGRWYSGTKITGTSTTATIFADSGITSAVIGDMYLNTSTYNTYRCTVGGNASTAKWIYVNNIKGTTGKGISSITNQYYLSTSDTTQSDGSWSDTPQTYIEGRYYWTRSHIVWDDGGSPTNTTPVLDNALTDANANAIDARKVATNYLSMDSTGIMVADMQDGEQTPSTATGRNVFIDNTSVNIRDRQTVLASFDDNEVQIGKEGNIISHFTDRSMKIGLNNTSFIELGCINGADGRTYMKLVSSTFISELKTDWKISEFHHAEYADGVDATNDITIVDEYHFTVKDRRNVTLYVHYWTNDPTPVFTFGTRVEGGGRGFRSMTIGKNNIASGQDSFAVGENNFIKTTEGDNGIRGIALGGNNTVTARDSQAMGCYCEAKGLFSHAHGCYVIAASSYQTAIGAYNAEDTEGKNLFIIGNGVNTSDRSNALAVDWHGNIYLDMNITNSTTNQNLLTAITNAGWDDDVYDD